MQNKCDEARERRRGGDQAACRTEELIRYLLHEGDVRQIMELCDENVCVWSGAEIEAEEASSCFRLKEMAIELVTYVSKKDNLSEVELMMLIDKARTSKFLHPLVVLEILSRNDHLRVADIKAYLVEWLEEQNALVSAAARCCQPSAAGHRITNSDSKQRDANRGERARNRANGEASRRAAKRVGERGDEQKGAKSPFGRFAAFTSIKRANARRAIRRSKCPRSTSSAPTRIISIASTRSATAKNRVPPARRCRGLRRATRS